MRDKGTIVNYDPELAKLRAEDLELIQKHSDNNWQIIQMFFTIIVVVCLGVTFNYSPKLAHLISSI